MNKLAHPTTLTIRLAWRSRDVDQWTECSPQARVSPRIPLIAFIPGRAGVSQFDTAATGLQLVRILSGSEDNCSVLGCQLLPRVDVEHSCWVFLSAADPSPLALSPATPDKPHGSCALSPSANRTVRHLHGAGFFPWFLFWERSCASLFSHQSCGRRGTVGCATQIRCLHNVGSVALRRAMAGGISRTGTFDS